MQKIENELMRTVGLKQLVREDLEVNQRDWGRPGTRAAVVYRFGVWARSREHGLTRFIFSALHSLVNRYIRNVYGIEISPTAKIGRRLHIGHQGGIVIHRHATIGDDLLIRQGVTLGIGGIDRREFGPEFAPVLGDRVDLGVGAVVMGKVRIGNDVKIGPNAVVVTDVPDSTTVMAPPSRFMSRPKAD
ncbi:serine acetyltransferase [Devosia sp. LC5]|uniref:serine O-acetyltransferase n=1 Tax=Devosia sp. LC5 TaxID=1502724 RepID=UPI000690C495|nr:serine acetyltransferase [Devosia sp. LC5]